MPFSSQTDCKNLYRKKITGFGLYVVLHITTRSYVIYIKFNVNNKHRQRKWKYIIM